MSEFLIFQLYGAMASWGDIAVGEQRPTTPQPSKSIVLGLLAAALGIRRHEDEAHQKLAAGYGFAVRVDATGVLLRDYHTTQNIKNTNRLKHLYTRRDELADKDNIYTILSSRDYRCDGLYSVCLWMRDEEEIKEKPPALTVLNAALRKPYFTLYLGRKSCPLTVPIVGHLINAETLEAAFAKFDEENEEKQRFLTKKYHFAGETDENGKKKPVFCYWDEAAPTALTPLHRTPRTDHPLSRQRRQFSKRTEYYGQLQGD